MKVLIVGSSFIYRAPNGSMASTTESQFRKMADIAGKDLDLTATYLGGGSVKAHWDDNFRINAQDEIRHGGYDIVVLNGADEPGFNEYSNRFARLIEQNDAKLVMNGIWTFDAAIDASGSPENQRMHEEYKAIALRHDAGYAPNGLTMTRAHAELTERYGRGDNGQTAEDMLTVDNIHGTALANYMMASNMFRAVFGEAPPSAAAFRPAGVSLSDARLIEQISGSVFRAEGRDVDDSAPTPTPPPPAPEPTPPTPRPTPPEPTPDDPETARFFGRVFADRDRDGIEDSNETGISGVKVELISGGTVIGDVVTNAKGYYYFGRLASDDYQVRFVNTKPELNFSPANRGAENKDSDVVSVASNGTGLTARFDLEIGETGDRISAGLMQGETPAPSPTPSPPSGGGDVFNVVRGDFDTEVIGNNSNQRLNGTGGDNYMLGGGGSDTLNGYRGDDYLDGGSGRDTLNGNIGADVFVFDRNDAAINGGSQIDRILFHNGSWQDARKVDISSVEIFDMKDGARDTMTLSFNDTRAGRDRQLEIYGDDTDILRIETNRSGEKLGTYMRDGEEMTRYKIDFATFAVDSDVFVYVDDILIS